MQFDQFTLLYLSLFPLMPCVPISLPLTFMITFCDHSPFNETVEQGCHVLAFVSFSDLPEGRLHPQETPNHCSLSTETALGFPTLPTSPLPPASYSQWLVYFHSGIARISGLAWTTAWRCCPRSSRSRCQLPRATHHCHQHLSAQKSLEGLIHCTSAMSQALSWASVSPWWTELHPWSRAITLSWKMSEGRWVSLSSEEFDQLQKYAECKCCYSQMRGEASPLLGDEFRKTELLRNHGERGSAATVTW